ncbi:hypothetical protein F2981_18980 (plasmid) [Sinorhizobium meliloti]|nr:hypothetical protein [Sinorhizobium meliloti]
MDVEDLSFQFVNRHKALLGEVARETACRRRRARQRETAKQSDATKRFDLEHSSGLCAIEFLSSASQGKTEHTAMKGIATIYSSRYLTRNAAMKNADIIA